MASTLDLRSAENIRKELTKTQQKDIERMYRRIARNIQKEAEGLPNTTSGRLRKMYLKKLRKEIEAQLNPLGEELENMILSNMLGVAAAVCEDSLEFLRAIGMPVEGAFLHVPADVVQTVITGQLYEGRWSLSKAVWQNTAKIKRDLNTVIAEGIAQNKSAYDIAKDLERYVNPSARKPWDWNKVYPGTAKKIDYNAQRLARTMVSHAYQQAFVVSTQKNPFVTAYRWDSSNSSRVCEICSARDGVTYKKDELPLDHPNGMCTFIAVMEGPMVDMADRLADWVEGKPDPELDVYAEFLKNS